jgi:large subunit ribosomal protein L6
MSRVGSQPIPVPSGVEVAISGSEVTVKGPKGKLQQRFDPGMILSVGIGYRAHQSGKSVSLSVMLSHTVEVEAPPGIELTVEGTNIVRVSGADKQAVGQVAAKMRAVRPPNAYTGKGIRYQGQQIKLKPGKSARRALE